MTTEPLSFTGRLSLQDCLDIQRYYSRLLIRPAIQYCIIAAIVTIAAAAIADVSKTGFSFRSAVSLTLCAVYPLAVLYERLAVRWSYSRQLDTITDHTVTLTGETVATISPKAEVRLAWDQLGPIVATPRGLLFLVGPRSVWFWLPQRLFEGNTHRETILALAAKHKLPIRQMK